MASFLCKWHISINACIELAESEDYLQPIALSNFNYLHLKMKNCKLLLFLLVLYIPFQLSELFSHSFQIFPGSINSILQCF